MSEVISRLKLESGEFDSKVKRAAQGIQNLVDECHKAGGTLNKLEDENRKYIQSLGRMETVSKTARGSLAELTAGFMDIKHAYNQLSQEEKKGEVGRELNKQLGILKQRVLDAKKEIKGMESELSGSKFGQFGSVIDTVGQKFGITGNLTEMLTSKTALMTAGIGASIAVITKATESWASYNSELAKQQQITSVTTGLKGDDAGNMTAAARSISKVYGTDFREVINAANTLMAQFGETGDEAIQLLRDGMQGMIQGDGPKLLSMIQQYAPAFRDAGVSASQLIAVIQNSEGGIFTDQNMSAIVMGIKNIRLMTNATSEALGKLGIDGQKMSQDLSNGTITVFDALKQVAGAIEGVGSGSQAAGEVMQTVFGRQRAMAGTKLGEAIATLNLNLDETKKQTGEVGEGYDDLTGAVYRFERALQKTFGFKGWQEMENFIKTDFYNTLSDVVEVAGRVYQTFASTEGMLDEIGRNTAFENLLVGINSLVNPLLLVAGLIKDIKDGYASMHPDTNLGQGSGTGGVVGQGGANANVESTYTETRDATGKLINATRNGSDVTSDILAYYRKLAGGSGGSGGGQKGGGKVEPVFDPTSIAAQEKKIQDLTKAWREASAAEREYKKGLLEMAKGELAVMNGSQKPIGDIASGQAVNVGLAGIGGAHFDKKQGKYIEDGLAIDVSKIKTPLQAMEEELQRLIELQAQFGGVSAEAWGIYQDQIDDAQKKIAKFKGKDVGEKNEKAWQGAAQAVQSVGSAFSSIEDPSVKAAGTVMQAIASIALGFATASSQANTAGTGWGWIAWLAAGAAAMATTISTIHSLTGYAQGGIVKGNSYSGDNVPAMVGGAGGELVGLNAGEVVLTKAMQSNLAIALQNGGGAGSYSPSHISGEQIYIVLNRYTKRSGKGEIVTWR